MAFKLVILKKANIEISESIIWYENRQEGLGDRFYNNLVSNLEYLVTNPHLFSIKSRNLRELKLSVFPFLIIYEILDDIVIIHAVFNTSKNPGKKPKL